MSQLNMRSARRDRGQMVIGLILVALGVIFFIGQWSGLNMARVFWPFFVIIPGLAFFAGMVFGGKKAGGLAIPGSIITTVGLILLYQNTFGTWASWSYVWALIPAAVGGGLIINGIWSEQPRLVQEGRRVALIGLVLFALFGTFFELMLNISGFWRFGGWFWPLLLIALGVFLLARRLFEE